MCFPANVTFCYHIGIANHGAWRIILTRRIAKDRARDGCEDPIDGKIPVDVTGNAIYVHGVATGEFENMKLKRSTESHDRPAGALPRSGRVSMEGRIEKTKLAAKAR